MPFTPKSRTLSFLLSAGTITLSILSGCRTDSTTASTASHEPYRPVFHFTPDSAWMNDPNGLVYINKEYHLFYQYYPNDIKWGPMHWGHAISADLVHWQHLPIALYPDSLGYIFSGSAVADVENTSGLGTTEHPPLVAIFTHHDPVKEKNNQNEYQSQSIAYSIDFGRTWKKFDENPVLKNPGIKDFRDPKVSWHEPTKKWIMALAVQDHIAFYSSPDLKSWKHESDFGKDLGAHGGVWECPDLFPLSDPDQAGNEKWVLLVSINPGGPNKGSATQYFVGDFDGSTFSTTQTETKWLDYGTDDYAGVTWFGTDKRRLFIGWMSNWLYRQEVPTEKWRSAMTTPRELHLIDTPSAYVLSGFPVDELNVLKTNRQSGNIDKLHLSEACWLHFTLQTAEDENGITLFNDSEEKVTIGWSKSKSLLYVDRSQSGNTKFSPVFVTRMEAPFRFSTDQVEFDILIDRASLEIFVNKGALQVTALVFPSSPYLHARLLNDEAQDVLTGPAELSDMKSIW